MNTVTKKLFLTFGLCVMLVGITQPAEHKRAESASELLPLPIGDSVEPLGTVDPEDEGSSDPHNREEDLNNGLQLMGEVKRDAAGKLKNPDLILGTDRFPQEPFKGPKKVKLPREIRPKSKWAGCLSCLAK